MAHCIPGSVSVADFQKICSSAGPVFANGLNGAPILVGFAKKNVRAVRRRENAVKTIRRRQDLPGIASVLFGKNQIRPALLTRRGVHDAPVRKEIRIVIRLSIEKLSRFAGGKREGQ